VEIVLAAIVTTIGAVLVALIQKLRKENTQQHDENGRTMRDVQRLQADIALTLARHTSEELERYAAIVAMIAKGFNIAEPVFKERDDHVL
jgi:hypothetical protein